MSLSEPKSFQKRPLDVKRVSAQFAVANADAHATASRSGPILSHAADNEASNACIVDGCQKVVIPFRPTTIRDDADGIEVFQAHVAEICHGRNLRSSLAGEIPQRDLTQFLQWKSCGQKRAITFHGDFRHLVRRQVDWMTLINELFPVPESPSMATFTKRSRAASACASSLTSLKYF